MEINQMYWEFGMIHKIGLSLQEGHVHVKEIVDTIDQRISDSKKEYESFSKEKSDELSRCESSIEKITKDFKRFYLHSLIPLFEVAYDILKNYPDQEYFLTQNKRNLDERNNDYNEPKYIFYFLSNKVGTGIFSRKSEVPNDKLEPVIYDVTDKVLMPIELIAQFGKKEESVDLAYSRLISFIKENISKVELSDEINNNFEEIYNKEQQLQKDIEDNKQRTIEINKEIKDSKQQHDLFLEQELKEMSQYKELLPQEEHQAEKHYLRSLSQLYEISCYIIDNLSNFEDYALTQRQISIEERGGNISKPNFATYHLSKKYVTKLFKHMFGLSMAEKKPQNHGDESITILELIAEIGIEEENVKETYDRLIALIQENIQEIEKNKKP